MTDSRKAENQLSSLATELNPIALDCGAILSKDTKKLLGYQLSNGNFVYIRSELSDTKNLVLMIDPDLGLEKIKELPGIDPADVDDEEKFHSNMTGYPKKKHNGENPITYAYKATVHGLDNFKKILLALSKLPAKE